MEPEAIFDKIAVLRGNLSNVLKSKEETIRLAVSTLKKKGLPRMPQEALPEFVRGAG